MRFFSKCIFTSKCSCLIVPRSIFRLLIIFVCCPAKRTKSEPKPFVIRFDGNISADKKFWDLCGIIYLAPIYVDVCKNNLIIWHHAPETQRKLLVFFFNKSLPNAERKGNWNLYIICFCFIYFWLKLRTVRRLWFDGVRDLCTGTVGEACAGRGKIKTKQS